MQIFLLLVSKYEAGYYVKRLHCRDNTQKSNQKHQCRACWL